MKDLYRALKLAPLESNPNKIRSALEYAGGYKNIGEHVLLDQGRKRVYDRTYETLMLIGKVRKNLDINDKPFWVEGDNKDFTFSGDKNRKIQDEIKKENLAPRRSVMAKSKVAAVFVLVAISFGYFVSQYPESVRPAPRNASNLLNCMAI